MKKYNIKLFGQSLLPINAKKKYRHLFMISLLTLGAINFASCESKDIFDDEQFVLPPVEPQEIVQVMSDDGFLRVNSLSKAIAENGDAIYELERGGIYYLEGKNVISHNVIIRAGAGTGPLPIIQPMSDAQGAINADMLRLEANVSFENIYFNGEDAASAKNIMQRLFRIDAPDVRLKFEGCFVEYCRNFCIRTDNVNNKIYINNSTFRNLALTTDPANGRLFDSRGNAQDTISITNSTIYNMTGNIVRFDGAIMNYFEFNNNTVYNIGNHMRIDYAMTTLIQNNVFADVGWKSGYDADTPGAFWDLKQFKNDGTHDPLDVRITISNNNVFISPDIEALYSKYPDNIARIPLNSTAETLIASGQMIYEKNISETLTFEKAIPLPMEYIDKFFEVLNTGMSQWADLEFYVKEGNPIGDNNKKFNLSYPSSSISATASTSGGPLGAPMWYK